MDRVSETVATKKPNAETSANSTNKTCSETQVLNNLSDLFVMRTNVSTNEVESEAQVDVARVN